MKEAPIQKESLEDKKLTDKNSKYLAKGLATLGVCILASVSMIVTDGNTGIGWGILGLFFIWG